MLGIGCLGLTAAACSSSSSSSSSSAASSPSASASSPAASASASSAATGTGAVDVLYAGSLVNLITKQVGPAFSTASGYSVTGAGAGSTALVTDIKGKVYKGDVFISASPTATKTLIGTANGDWVSWYVSFASSKLVLGYNPKSKFASEIKSEPWYKAITTPGLKLGFTDPATDPKGKLVAEALSGTAKAKNLPALTTIENDKGDVFPEETLVARLQAGQIDAAFFYTIEATPVGIPTVPLAGEDLKATYTISTLKGAPNEPGADAFTAYLLGPSGQAVLKQDGFALITPPKVTGSGVPATVQSALP
ncbi:MAG: molybdate transport system substrate-binding protein [Trebonia sp.]|nr:molybdate transport system substrate-binding protein [Trebonia sp.]